MCGFAVTTLYVRGFTVTTLYVRGFTVTLYVWIYRNDPVCAWI